MKKSGFTLVELMIVIAIIGILIAVLYPSITGYFERVRDTKKKVELNQINLAIMSYFDDNFTYKIPDVGCKDNACMGIKYEGTGFMNTDMQGINWYFQEKSIIQKLQELGYLGKNIATIKFSTNNYSTIDKNLPICNTRVSNIDAYIYRFDDTIGRYAIFASLENPKKEDLENIQNLLHYDNVNGAYDGACKRYGKNYGIGN